jgi:hypothetical protein
MLMGAAAVLVLLSGCERSSAVASLGGSHGNDRGSSYDDRGGADRRGSSDRGGGGSYRPDENVRLVDGKPI